MSDLRDFQRPVITSAQTVAFDAISLGAATVLTLPKGDSEIELTSNRGTPQTSLYVKLSAPNTDRQYVTITYKDTNPGTIAHDLQVYDHNDNFLGSSMGTTLPDSMMLVNLKGEFVVAAQQRAD
jgi:hypothetical protein